MHDLAGGLCPLVVGQHAVLRRGADRAVPHRPVEPVRAERRVRLLQQAVQPAELAAAVIAQRWFQLGRVPPPGDDVRVGVLRVPSRPEQVVDQSFHALPVRTDLPDHRRIRFRTSSAAWSSRSALRRLSAAYGRRSPERCPVEFQPRHRLVQVDANPADQAGGPHEFSESLTKRGFRRNTSTTRSGKRRLGRIRSLGQPGQLGGSAHLAELLVAEIEPHRAGPLGR